MPCNEKVAWAAGLLEADGTIYPDRIVVDQNDRWILDELKAIFGGSIFEYTAPKGSPMFRWALTGPAVRELVWAMLPHLSPRRANRVIEQGILTGDGKREKHREYNKVRMRKYLYENRDEINRRRREHRRIANVKEV